MTDLSLSLSDLRRPRLLVQAARIGAQNLLNHGKSPPRKGLDRILAEESQMEVKRKDGEADYSPRRHVDLLVAVILAAQAAGQAVLS